MVMVMITPSVLNRLFRISVCYKITVFHITTSSFELRTWESEAWLHFQFAAWLCKLTMPRKKCPKHWMQWCNKHISMTGKALSSKGWPHCYYTTCTSCSPPQQSNQTRSELPSALSIYLTIWCCLALAGSEWRKWCKMAPQRTGLTKYWTISAKKVVFAPFVRCCI